MRIRMVLAVVLIAMSMQALTKSKAASADVDFKGNLVAEPCVVAPGGDGENVVVDFGTVAEKTFYSIYGRRSAMQKFHITLTECDIYMGKDVSVTFTGTPDAEQPDRLALSSSSGVRHIAVGIQTAEGEELPVNKQSKNYVLKSGTTLLEFMAYLQASDSGVRDHSVGRGSFEAVSTFELEYP